METKAVTEDFSMRIGSGWTPFDLQGTMEEIEKIFEECDRILAGAEMSPTGYVKQTEKIEDVFNGMCILNGYVLYAHNQVYNELDHPLFLGFSKGATETLSRINLNDLTTDNTFRMEEHYLVDGSQYSYMYEYEKRIKPRLTMEDFLGLVDVKAQDWMPTLENVETVGIFAQLFRMEYQGMNPSDADINLFLRDVLVSGEFDHKAYHPVRDFLSAVADVTIILPLIESIVGYDFITKEDLTDLECGLKAAGAIIDLLTFGDGAILMKAAGKGPLQFAFAVGKTMAVDALASGASYLTGQMLEDMGMPAGLSTIMTAIVSGAVTYSTGKYFFKNEAGEIVRECTEDELEKLVKGEVTDVADDVIKGGTGTVKNTGNINHGGRIVSDDIADFVSEADGGMAKDGFGKLSEKSFTVTQKGIDRVKSHISSNGFDAYENTEMINRLENALKNGDLISGADASFYMHELKESALMQSGISYEEAHRAALDFFEVSDFSVYHPDVIKMEPMEWNSAWKKFWNIE